MIKFSAAGNDKIIIGLGLEPENIKRLQANQPVRVKLSDMGFTGPIAMVQIMIFTGSSKEAMIEAIKPFMNSDTVVHNE